MTEILEQLESNDKELAQAAREKLTQTFSTIKDPWLVNGLFERYLETSSSRILDVLTNLIDSHHSFLFDRVNEAIKHNNTEVKVKSLTLLGHIVKSQPMWLYKICEHSLLKSILTLLKHEIEILPLISALLVIVVLMPMIPSSMGVFLNDIFEIFGRLASWNCTTEKNMQEYLEHMQMALYALFIRLYGMFPCNFLAYLRTHYREKQKAIFGHTIKPMLTTVRMHPSLVTSSKDTEVASERWKTMSVYDIIIECERFSLDASDRCCHDSCQMSSGIRSRSGTTNSNIEKSYQHINNSVIRPSSDIDFFSADSLIRSDCPYKPLPIKPVSTTLNSSEQLREVSPVTTVVKGRSPAVPSSPLRIIPPANLPFRGPDSPSHREDEEVSSIIASETSSKPTPRQCDSVLHDNSESGDNNANDLEHGSPCSAGGLHMPNMAARKKILRLRYHSLSLADNEKQQVSTGSSPGSGTAFLDTTVRRASSCPEMKKSPATCMKDSIVSTFHEVEEESLHEEHVKAVSDCETQTDSYWPMPYEHLFLSIFPASDNDDKSSTVQSPPIQPSVYDIFDKYMELACSSEANRLKDKTQLQLLYQQLLFERSRRETHAYRNRRLLADAKNIRLLEEYNSALKDQIQLQQREISDLRAQLSEEKQSFQRPDSVIGFLKNKNNQLIGENEDLKSRSTDLELELKEMNVKYEEAMKKHKILEEKLRDADAEIKSVSNRVKEGSRCKAQLEKVNVEMLMLNELLMKYKQKLTEEMQKPDLSSELLLLKDSCHKEHKRHLLLLEHKTVIIDTLKCRIEEMEEKQSTLEADKTELKNFLNEANKANRDRILVVNDKYQSLSAYNALLEEKLLDLTQMLDTRQENTRSPDLSSCQEVIASPLSLSIEGSTKQLDSQEFVNLQETISSVKEDVLQTPIVPVQGEPSQSKRHWSKDVPLVDMKSPDSETFSELSSREDRITPEEEV